MQVFYFFLKVLEYLRDLQALKTCGNPAENLCGNPKKY